MIFVWQYNYTNELQHFGVLGMKWGVRKKKQNNSGSSTYNKSSIVSKSKHQIKIEEKYRLQGMSEKDATSAAEKRIKTEKIIAAVAGLTVVAAATYVTVKHYKNKTPKEFVDDILIKKGTTMNRVTKTIEKSTDYKNRTFVADEFMDKALYKTMMPGYWRGQGYTGPVYQNELKAVTNIIAPSKSKTQKILQEVVTENSEYVRSLFTNKEKIADLTDEQITEKYFKKLSGYIADSPIDDPFTSSYLKILSEKGYKAVVDWNDADGFATKPIILLDAANDIKIIKQYVLNQK